jgi:glucosylceramidase
VASRNDDGTLALIATNAAGEPRRFAVRTGNRAFTYELPAKSVATFTWK